MENGQVLHSSLYVEQIDKFAVSLKQLAKTFLKLEEKKQTFSEDEIDEMLLFIRDSFIPAFIDLEAVLKVKLTEAETDWE